MIVVLLGPPGVGKGTQAGVAADSHGWKHLSTGEMLREEAASGSELGREVQEIMDRGDLVPDALMVEMVAGRLAEIGPDEVLLLDGFPRTEAQAEALAERVGGSHPLVAVYFTAPESVLTQRLLGRGRSDDTPEAIRHRLEVYRRSTRPLVDWFRARGVLHEISADRPVEEIQRDFLHVVQDALADASRPS